MDPDEIIEHLELEPHPEGGWFKETWRHVPGDGSRGAGTAIYYLLRAGERSHWHRLDADEIFHHYSGGPLRLSMADADGGPVRNVVIGDEVLGGQIPQALIPAGTWFSAEPLGEYTLLGCTVAPAFEFEGFELAPKGWHPGGG